MKHIKIFSEYTELIEQLQGKGFQQRIDIKDANLRQSIDQRGLIGVKIPFINKKHIQDEQKKSYSNLLKSVIGKYKTIVDTISKITKVSKKLIYTIIMIESDGKETAGNETYKGLMALSTVTAGDAITFQQMKGKMTSQKKTALLKFLGEKRLNMYLKRNNLSVKATPGLNITNADLMKPEFNILCGALYLDNLIDKYTENGTARLEKIIWGYNVGFFSKVPGSTPEGVYNNAPPETKTYLAKANGINGILSLFKNLEV